MHQLSLFKYPKPLIDRFGKEFFQNVPRAPGVYIMSGSQNRILYIGQSKNLRTRLAFYKNAQPERAPRKIIRLVHRVELITWELCRSAEAARLRENELLHLHRPRFNVVNTHPQMYSFVTRRLRDGILDLRLDSSPSSGPSIHCHGAFKNRSLVREALGAFARLIWAATHSVRTHADYPTQLLQSKAPLTWRIDISRLIAASRDWLASFHDYWEGTSVRCLELMSIESRGDNERFLEQMQTVDRETIKEFFQSGPERHRELRLRHEIPEPVIPQDRLDDLISSLRADRPKPGALLVKSEESSQFS